MLCAHEIIQHVRRVDEGEDRGDGGGFSGQEGVAAAEILWGVLLARVPRGELISAKARKVGAI
jgi:hypothetical protein